MIVNFRYLEKNYVVEMVSIIQFHLDSCKKTDCFCKEKGKSLFTLDLSHTELKFQLIQDLWNNFFILNIDKEMSWQGFSHKPEYQTLF